MTKDVILDHISMLLHKVDQPFLLPNKKNRLLKRLQLLESDFKKLDVKKFDDGQAAPLTDKIRVFVADVSNPDDASRLLKRAGALTNELFALYGAYAEKSDRVNGYYYTFIVCTLLFLLICPFMIGPLYSIFVLIPLYFLVVAVKMRKKVGFYLSLLLVPAGLAVAVIQIVYAVQQIIPHYRLVVADRVANGIPELLAAIITIGVPILSVLLVLGLIVLVVMAVRVRPLFQ